MDSLARLVWAIAACVALLTAVGIWTIIGLLLRWAGIHIDIHLGP